MSIAICHTPFFLFLSGVFLLYIYIVSMDITILNLVLFFSTLEWLDTPWQTHPVE
jgi:hypothetical protein